MSHVGPPPPSGGPPPPGFPVDFGHPAPPSRPAKKRPRLVWVVLPAVLCLIAAAGAVLTLLLGVKASVVTDGIVEGSSGRVTSPPHTERMLFSIGLSDRCVVHDGTGRRLRVTPYYGNATVDTGGQHWQASGTFDSGDGHLRVHCAASGPTRVGAPVTAGSIFKTIGTVFALVAVSLALLAWFVTMLVLRLTRRPSPHQA